MEVWSRTDNGVERQPKALLYDLQQLLCVWACLIGIDRNLTPRRVVTVIIGRIMKTKNC